MTIYNLCGPFTLGLVLILSAPLRVDGQIIVCNNSGTRAGIVVGWQDTDTRDQFEGWWLLTGGECVIAQRFPIERQETEYKDWGRQLRHFYVAARNPYDPSVQWPPPFDFSAAFRGHQGRGRGRGTIDFPYSTCLPGDRNFKVAFKRMGRTSEPCTRIDFAWFRPQSTLQTAYLMKDSTILISEIMPNTDHYRIVSRKTRF